MAKQTARVPRNADQRMAAISIDVDDLFADSIDSGGTRTRPEMMLGGIGSEDEPGPFGYVEKYGYDELAGRIRNAKGKAIALVEGRDFAKGQLSKIVSRVSKALRADKRGELMFGPGELIVRPIKEGDSVLNGKGEATPSPANVVKLAFANAG